LPFFSNFAFKSDLRRYVLDSSGQLIGINTAIYSNSGSSSGVGFALPSDMVSGIVDQIIQFGRVTRPIIGITFAPDAAVEQLGLGGVLVLDARQGGPAARAGVKPTTVGRCSPTVSEPLVKASMI
jgi:S1-C subfamily serine protease